MISLSSLSEGIGFFFSVTVSQTYVCTHMFLSMESTAFHPQLFVARPSLVLGWLKSQVLRQILQCHISPLRVGAKAAQSFQTTSLKTTAQRFKWFRQQTPAYVQRCVCVCVLEQVNGLHSLLLSPFIGVRIFISAFCGFACGRRKHMVHVYERACSLMSH